jgi:beta-1,4-mannosyl-glycoprotein beta-1,4-N-acetylglucosaminyltransferase
MIIDTFMFRDEIDMLEFRLRLLYGLVDKFVIVESDRTFSGERKPFNINNYRNGRLAPFAEKIICHQFSPVIEGLDLESKPSHYDESHDCWNIEHQQREAILDAVRPFGNNDIMLMGDLDEIPSHEALMQAKLFCERLPAVCVQQFFYYNLTCLREEAWPGTTIAPVKMYRERGAQEVRDIRREFPGGRPGGWHLSYFGGLQKIQHKIRTFSHQEFNNETYLNPAKIQNHIKTGTDLFDRPVKSRTVDARNFPPYFNMLAVDYDWGLKGG